MMAAAAETALIEPPTDGIASVRFDSDTNLLAAASWDCGVHIYDADANTKKALWKFKAPVLDTGFISSEVVCGAGLDKSVQIYDIASSTATVMGMHEAPVRTLDYCADKSMLLSGSWDCTVQAWDARAPGEPIATIACPGKVYTANLADDNTYIVGCDGRQTHIYDLRKVGPGADALLYARESALKHQTRCIRAFVDGQGYLTSSIEGRCSIDWVNPEEQNKKYSFKCHRHKLPGGEERIFPVNALAFHPIYGTFVTGGGDGNVYSWDYKAKKRLAAVITEAGASIASMAYNKDGKKLAVAVSYTWEQGEREHPTDRISIVNVTDAQARSK